MWIYRPVHLRKAQLANKTSTRTNSQTSVWICPKCSLTKFHSYRLKLHKFRRLYKTLVYLITYGIRQKCSISNCRYNYHRRRPFLPRSLSRPSNSNKPSWLKMRRIRTWDLAFLVSSNRWVGGTNMELNRPQHRNLLTSACL